MIDPLILASLGLGAMLFLIVLHMPIGVAMAAADTVDPYKD